MCIKNDNSNNNGIFQVFPLQFLELPKIFGG